MNYIDNNILYIGTLDRLIITRSHISVNGRVTYSSGNDGWMAYGKPDSPVYDEIAVVVLPKVTVTNA